jgi:hypothetical protein
MDESGSNHWRQLLERGGRPRTPERAETSSYDDGYQPPGRSDGNVRVPASQQAVGSGVGTPPLSPQEITEEAALALAHDSSEYQPWVLQRGRSRPAMMLHLRRFEPRSGLWMGWELSYPHLVAAEYTGDKLLSLDFGTRQFMLEGSGLDELARHLQTGGVLLIQEYAMAIWPGRPGGSCVSAIRKIGAGDLGSHS